MAVVDCRISFCGWNLQIADLCYINPDMKGTCHWNVAITDDQWFDSVVRCPINMLLDLCRTNAHAQAWGTTPSEGYEENHGSQNCGKHLGQLLVQALECCTSKLSCRQWLPELLCHWYEYCWTLLCFLFQIEVMCCTQWIHHMWFFWLWLNWYINLFII